MRPEGFPAPGIRWTELGLLATRYYAEHHDGDWDGLRIQLLEAKDLILALVEGYT